MSDMDLKYRMYLSPLELECARIDQRIKDCEEQQAVQKLQDEQLKQRIQERMQLKKRSYFQCIEQEEQQNKKQKQEEAPALMFQKITYQKITYQRCAPTELLEQSNIDQQKIFYVPKNTQLTKISFQQRCKEMFRCAFYIGPFSHSVGKFQGLYANELGLHHFWDMNVEQNRDYSFETLELNEAQSQIATEQQLECMKQGIIPFGRIPQEKYDKEQYFFVITDKEFPELSAVIPWLTQPLQQLQEPLKTIRQEGQPQQPQPQQLKEEIQEQKKETIYGRKFFVAFIPVWSDSNGSTQHATANEANVMPKGEEIEKARKEWPYYNSSSWATGRVTLPKSVVHTLIQDPTFPGAIWTKDQFQQQLQLQENAVETENSPENQSPSYALFYSCNYCSSLPPSSLL